MFLLLSTKAGGQNYFFEKYGVEEGISSSKVYTMIQDRDDHIWLGTESGVSRFDGTRFVNYGPNDGMASGGVYSMCQDSTGRIWLGHLNGGISCYNGEKFYNVRIDSNLVSTDITSITQTGNYIWFTTIADGAVRIPFPEQGDTLLTGKQYRGKEGLSDQVIKMYVDREGVIYCIVDLFLKKYNPTTDLFETYNPPNLTKYFNVIVMFEDSKGNFWYGTHNGGLYMAEKSSGKMKVYDSRDGLSKNMVTSITEDFKGNIWVGTWGGGITRFSDDNIQVFNKSNGLNSQYIHAILEDREKNILIADHNEGLSIYKGDYLVTYSDGKILPDPNVWAISQDDRGYYWFATNTGVAVYNPEEPTDNAVTIYNNAKNFIGSDVRFIKNDHQGSMWLGTKGEGISRFDVSAGRFVFDINLNNILPTDRTITALETDHNNNLWIGTNDGVVFWNKRSEEGTRFTQIKGLYGNYVTALFCDRDGILWIGSERKSGLTKHLPGSDRFTAVDLGEDIVPRTICQTDDGRIWVGTTAGVYIIKDNRIIQTLTEDDGLISNNVKILQAYGDKFLYIGTNQGLNRYNLTDGSLATFTKRNGFTGVESHENASFADDNGKVWFGTANGVTMLDPDKAPPVATNPAVHIKLNIYHSARKTHDGMKLRYKENTFEFNYYSICLYNPESVKYKVMLKGSDADWRPADVQTRTFTSGQSPGHYTFMVKACNSDGYWNEVPETFSFTIRPPIYYSPGFIVLYVLIVAVSIIIYIKRREAKLRREKVMLEEKVEERTAEVVQKSLEIEAKNKDITASIRYAERIQMAMLPPENTFAETFVLFLPKDIVSGDFYWMYDGGNRKYIAAVDCTGHGVPGAFMSIIGHNSLTKIIREYNITKPSEILNSLHQEVVHALLQRTEKAIRDGMDISLIAYDVYEGVVEYAGAFNPLYHVRDGVVESIKADRFPIGFSEDGEPTNFKNHVLKVKKGDMLYMCSDGYADQFGGGTDTKFKTGRIKEILSKIYSKPVEEQKRRLEVALRQWMGDCPQVDDILFIGTRIT